jgi:hypothetical protein
MNRIQRFTVKCIILSIAIGQCCHKYPVKIPLGEWKYSLFVNDIRAGDALMSNKIVNGNYVLISRLTMGLADAKNISIQTITETMNFTPVKLESNNSIITDAKVQDMSTVAGFNGRRVEIIADKKKSVINLDRDFRLEGNYVLSRMISEGFRRDLVIETWIYDPNIELETPILVKSKVIGIEKVKIKETYRELIHIEESIEGIKSIDSFVDEEGIVIMVVIKMLNMNIVLMKD